MVMVYQVGIALFFHLIDFITGFIKALKLKQVSSSKMRDGMFKKVGFILCYIIAIVIDRYGYLVGFSLNFSILPVIVAYAVCTELISILENISKINPDLKINKLKDMFQVKEDDKNADETK